MNYESAPGHVSLSIYWQRPVAFDEHGRVKRRHGHPSTKLTWDQKLLRDILGVYHLGVVVHGVEYAFGNSHAPYCRRLGGEAGGVVAHRPCQAGPQNVFKDACRMGTTSMTAEHVDEIVEQLSAVKFAAAHYNRLSHNCVDFAEELCSWLGVVSEIPSWCHRGLTMARLMNIGADTTTTEGDSGLFRAPGKRSNSGYFLTPTIDSGSDRCDAAASGQADLSAGDTTAASNLDLPRQCTFDVLREVRPTTPRRFEEMPVCPKTQKVPRALFKDFEEEQKPVSMCTLLDEDFGFRVPVPSVWSGHNSRSAEAYPSLLLSLGFMQKAADESRKQDQRVTSTVCDIECYPNPLRAGLDERDAWFEPDLV